LSCNYRSTKTNLTETYRKAKLTPPVAAEEARISTDLEQSKLLCKQLDSEKGIESNPLFSEEIVNDLAGVQLLDRLVTYMRKVHFFCYYCGEEYDDDDELLKRCGQKHLRGKKREVDPPNVNTDSWANSLDTKIKNRIENPDNPKIYTGQAMLERKVAKFYAKHINKIDEEKYRCSICGKLFMGENFIRKHLSMKHTEETEKYKKKAHENQFFENFLSDPRRMTPNVQQNFGQSGQFQMQQGRFPRMNQRSFGGGWPPQTAFIPVPVPFYPPAYMPDPYQSRPNSFYSPSGGRGGGRGRRGGGGGNRGGGYRGSYSGGSHHNEDLPAPPGFAQDPRGLREYVDLDAPAEEVIQIDYRMDKGKEGQ